MSVCQLSCCGFCLTVIDVMTHSQNSTRLPVKCPHLLWCRCNWRRTVSDRQRVQKWSKQNAIIEDLFLAKIQWKVLISVTRVGRDAIQWYVKYLQCKCECIIQLKSQLIGQNLALEAVSAEMNKYAILKNPVTFTNVMLQLFKCYIYINVSKFFHLDWGDSSKCKTKSSESEISLKHRQMYKH